nr:MAG TPA: hypothetical protein [Caudoviricetes sp.]
MGKQRTYKLRLEKGELNWRKRKKYPIEETPVVNRLKLHKKERTSSYLRLLTLQKSRFSKEQPLRR